MRSPVQVLVVDDDPAVQRTLTRVLQAQGMEVLTSGCAAEALVYLNREDVDVVISDYKMPGSCGLEFLEKAMSRQQNLECILLTGEVANLPQALSWAESIGVRAVLPKPCETDRLVQEVLRASEESRYARRPLK